MPTALITGATSGIGKACAYSLAEKSYSLILTGRRQDRLESIQTDIEKKWNVSVQTLCFDLRSKEECQNIFKENSATLEKIDLLINNAGLASGVDPMDTAQIEDWDNMVDTNIKGLLYMTRLSLPHLKKNAPSHIVNIGSVSGRWVYPGGGVYCSTKFAVRAISEGLRLDLNGSGVRVTNIEPGMVETEFSDVRLGDKDKAKAVYQGMTPLLAQDIANSVLWCVERPQHVNIQELVIFPTDQASVGLVHRT